VRELLGLEAIDLHAAVAIGVLVGAAVAGQRVLAWLLGRGRHA